MSLFHRPSRSPWNYLGFFVFMLVFWAGGEALIHAHWPPPWWHVGAMATISLFIEAFVRHEDDDKKEEF